ncbi:phage antirepressor KilAC domain-containing protein, partial [Acinetobacter baumannii]|nr:phage antirepressor Ant [Acinetobacter baumannii]EKX0497619.1 phage antirepressor Ant [Acinetobacter baumannii]EKX6771039.1 phage antirepressor Ant [Acinetobacter baumannii]EKX6776851.1 phage antirepressor Ant [Acinetobacter baumannii]
MQPIRVIYNQAYELLSTKHNTLGQPNLNEPIFSKEERVVVD